MIFCMLFVLVVCMQRFSNNELSFLNYRMFTVVSGSMIPKYNIGDVVTYKREGYHVTHRIIKIEKELIKQNITFIGWNSYFSRDLGSDSFSASKELFNYLYQKTNQIPKLIIPKKIPPNNILSTYIV